ncbi:MAG: hypothetical protein FWG45_04535 [Oscillospiraceae bacterium]|nr:hypothetical protein [Oscillospiraceae bacterium]
MNDSQLNFFAKMISSAMKSGDMDKVGEMYAKVSATADMEQAAKLEAMIAELMG